MSDQPLHNVEERVAQPLRDLAQQSPRETFTVVVRAVIDEHLDPKTAYADVPNVLEQVEAAIRTLIAAEPDDHHEKIILSGESANAPLLFAQLTGAHVLEVNRILDPALHVEFRRERVPANDPGQDFDRGSIVGRIIAEPLSSKIEKNCSGTYDVIIVLDVSNVRGREGSRQTVKALMDLLQARTPDQPLRYVLNENASHPYVFATLTGVQVLALLDLDRNASTGPRAIFRVWEDTTINALITHSIATVKADAAHAAFTAVGKGIVWAVLDSGCDGDHPHFTTYGNTKLTRPLRHRDFSGGPVDPAGTGDDPGAVVDTFGHGTHVAGILAGAWVAEKPGSSALPDPKNGPVILSTVRNEAGSEEKQLETVVGIAGMAPQCKIVSFRVLDDKGSGKVSSIIAAFDAIQLLNDYGRKIVVHGVNLSVGYPFDAKWFACGQSPLCVEVDRLVRSGVVVVVAAGNSGYGYLNTAFTKAWAAGLPMTINDPGNADLAITVGSTHRDAPHRYGVSYFSSKGPTGDGRMKPDLVAPGERIVSAASKQCRLPNTITTQDGSTRTIGADDFTYREDSGTSMAAPHVSGLVAAFLSIRNEFIGRPEDVKDLFLRNATDLRRDRTYQGNGLVDLMRTIQAV